MQYFIDSFGDITIGNAAILLCAAIFLFGCYKKVGKYFSDNKSSFRGAVSYSDILKAEPSSANSEMAETELEETLY